MSVVVAGARGSLGPHVVARLERDGHDLVPAGRDEVDLLDEASTTAWAGSLEGVTGVVHLVGGWRGGKPIAEAPREDDEWLHGLLVGTVQAATRAFLPHLTASGGRFAIVSARQAQQPTSTNAAYASAKAAAEAWTLALADELAPSGGTANIVVVNAIVTPQMRAENPDKEYRTFTDASQIAEAIAFLLGDGASKMNGQRLSLHG